MAAHAAQENVSPLDLILAVMREPHVALGQRVNATARAATEKVNQELTPLDFLQSVIRDAKTPAPLQIKVAQAIIPYIRPKQSLRPKRPAIVADRYGFAVDRECARKLRNKVARLASLKRRRNPADQKLIMRLRLELIQMTAALQCPCPETDRRWNGCRASAGRVKNSTRSRMPQWRTSTRATWLRLWTRNAGPRPVGRAERDRTKVPRRVWSAFHLP
jgi:hypothetical protein